MAKVSLRAYNREIEAMIDRSHLDEAVAHCQHILKTFPKHLETYRLLGKAYLEAKRHEEAVDIFSRVIAAEPNDFVAHVGMSIIRDEQNKLDDAIWHMERAFEVQSANSAIQGELQRLYGRRDGSQPQRIRMTRGALAHMYMRGELYPQAISESKSVLEQDEGRSDMQVLLAKAYYWSGQKNDAADAASAVLKRYPFCLDANLVLAEILSNDRPESAQVYRQRVIELDPYASQAVDNMFLAGKVSDAAVSIEHLEWNGQSVGMAADWRSAQAIGLESGKQEEEADWMKDMIQESAPPPVPAFESGQEASSTPVNPEDDIPEFLRAAGWGQTTGTFDESKSSIFDDEQAPAAEPIAEGDIPDWVKAMAPKEDSQPAGGEQDEELPDWISKIGTGELPVPSIDGSAAEELDWMKDLGQEDAVSPETSDEQSDWMKELGEDEQPVPATDDQMDWLKGFGEDDQTASVSDEQPDWFRGFEKQGRSAPIADEQPDLTEGLSDIEPSVSQPEAETPDGMKDMEPEDQLVPIPEDQDGWLKGIDSDPEPGLESQPSSDSEFLAELQSETEEPVKSQVSVSSLDTGSLGTSEKEQDDSFAWLEALAAKQGATEGLLTKPEERLENEPDWVKQAKGLNQSEVPPSEEEFDEPVKEDTATALPIDAASLGKTDKERDDSFAWLEALAAKQGATEGLLTKPEERLDHEPEWVRQVKKVTGELQSATGEQVLSDEESGIEDEMIVHEPETVLSNLTTDLADEPGESEAEQGDTFASLEEFATNQVATEALPTQPEEGLEQEPDSVRQAMDVDGELQQISTEPSTFPDSVLESEGVTSADTVSSWLKGLDEEEEESLPVAEDDTATWLKSLDELDEEPIASDFTASDDLPAWMQSLGGEQVPATESSVPAEEADVPVETAESAPEPESDDMPEWLSGLEDEEQKAPIISPADDLPAWLHDETGELVAEPTKIEPMRSSDWTPMDEKNLAAEVVPPPASEPAPEPKPEPSDQEMTATKAKKPSKVVEIKPATPSAPYKEPVTVKGTGMLTTPVDPILGSARNELSRSNIPGALDVYEKLIKKGRFLEDVIFDLREALYRYPVEVSIWQALGDAYMRANQLQDALDAYTKAEELLR